MYKLVLETGLLDLLKPPDTDEALHGPWWLRVSTPRLTTRSKRRHTRYRRMHGHQYILARHHRLCRQAIALW